MSPISTPFLLSGEFSYCIAKRGDAGGVSQSLSEKMELGLWEDKAARVLRAAYQRGDCCTREETAALKICRVLLHCLADY